MMRKAANAGKIEGQYCKKGAMEGGFDIWRDQCVQFAVDGTRSNAQ